MTDHTKHRYRSPLIDSECARAFQELAMALNPLKGTYGAFQLVKQGTTEPLTNDGQAQSARCVFCLKALKSWGAKPKGKKQAYWNKYDQLKDLQNTHTPTCAEDWAWRTLAKWWHETGSREVLIITKWLHKLVDQVKNGESRGYLPQNHVGLRAADLIVKMFPRLPSRDMKIVQAIELWIQETGFESRQWPDYKPFTHGTESHPHVFLPTKFADAEYGVWGMCPCGMIEWRGEDMPLEDRLIGWDRAGNGRAVRVGEHLHMKPVDEKLHIGASSRIVSGQSTKERIDS